MTPRRALGALLAVIAALVAGTALLMGTEGERERESDEHGVAFCTQSDLVEEEAREECEKEGHELTEPADALLSRVAFGSGRTAATDVLRRATAQARRSAARTRRAAPRLAAAAWSFVGPADIGGRILDLALDPQDANTIYAATAGGGVFRSADGGVTLESIWPDDAPQAVGALAITPSGVLYAGTGEAGPGGGSLTYGGDGVYRSRDRGRTWQRLPGLERTSRIGRIVVDPSDERRLWVAAVGNLFRPTADRGLYTSDDGGDTWRKVLSGANQLTGVVDVAIDPKDPRRLVAATWEHQRRPEERAYNGNGSGVFRSTDRGATWERVGSPLLGPHPLLGRIGVAIDPQQPDTVYAVASGLVGGHAGFFKSTDFGATWVPIISPEQVGLSGAFTYGWWFGRVWVDPNRSSDVYVAGLDLLRSTDGGLTFTSVSNGMHVDQHALVWDPRDPKRIFAGNDGGLYRSTDGGSNWTLAKVQPFSQPDALDVSEQDPSRIVGGLQDNGEIRTWGPRDEDGGGWQEFGPGGDGQRVTINPKDQNIVYACGQNGACEVSHDGGDTGTSFGDQVVSLRKAFFMPIELDPVRPSTVYAAGELVNRSDDDAGTWTPISPDLSDGPDTKELNPLYNGRGAVTAIGVAAKDAGRLYAGTDDGNLWYADSGGGPVGVGDWRQADDPDLPDAYVTRIEVDQRDPRIAYVTYSGFRSGDAASYVLRTTDGGASWTDITGDLPDAPVNDLNIVDDTLVVASDFGVYASRDRGARWFRVGRGLPLSPVFELRTHRPSRQLFVATFGRSMWKIGLDALDGLDTIAPTSRPARVKRRLSALPRRRSCAAGARLRFRVRATGAVLRRVTVTVNGRRVRTLRGRKLTQRIVLTLPRQRVRVGVTGLTTERRKLTTSRTYRACARRR